MSIDEQKLSFNITKADGKGFSDVELKDYELNIAHKDSFYVYSSDSPRIRLKEDIESISLDPDFREPSECTKDNISFKNKETYRLGVSEGVDIDFDPFQIYEVETGECRPLWEYKVTLADGSDLPPWIRFDEEATKISLMPHAKNEIGTYDVKLYAKELTEGL